MGRQNAGKKEQATREFTGGFFKGNSSKPGGEPIDFHRYFSRDGAVP